MLQESRGAERIQHRVENGQQIEVEQDRTQHAACSRMRQGVAELAQDEPRAERYDNQRDDVSSPTEALADEEGQREGERPWRGGNQPKQREAAQCDQDETEDVQAAVESRHATG